MSDTPDPTPSAETGTPPDPDDVRGIVARQRAVAEQRLQQQQEAEAKGRERLALAVAWAAAAQAVEPGGGVRDLPGGPEASLDAAVKAIASLNKALASRGLLDKLAGPPAGVAGEDLDAWQVAVHILRSAHEKPTEAGQLLGAIRGTPLAPRVRDWIVLGFRVVAEGRWLTGPLVIEITRPAVLWRDAEAEAEAPGEETMPAGQAEPPGPAAAAAPAPAPTPPATGTALSEPTTETTTVEATEEQPDRSRALSKVDQAVLLAMKHPDWSPTKIADEVGCTLANLSQSRRWQTVMEAREAAGQGKDLREGNDARARDHGGRHRGANMDEYADRGTEGPGAATMPPCASCGDPAGTDSEGRLLVHEGKPRCLACWSERNARP
jgi:hypothetical protein